MTGAAVAVLTRDSRIADEVARLCALAGTRPQMVGDVTRLSRAWSAAPAVVVDAAVADELAIARLPRRPGVVVVTTDSGRLDVWRLAADVGAGTVIELPAGEQLLVDQLVSATEPREAAAASVGIVPGSGGAGASTLAACLAGVSARRGAVTTLVDADPLGGGLDLVLGAEHAPGLRWPDLLGARGRLAASALREAVVVVDGVTLVSWDRRPCEPASPEAMQSVLAAARGGSSLVVVDLPRRFDAAARAAAAACDLVVLVVPADVRAVAAAAAVAAETARFCAQIHVVTRLDGRSGLEAADVATALGLPPAGLLPADRAVASAAASGRLGRLVSNGALRRAADSVFALLPPLGAAA